MAAARSPGRHAGRRRATWQARAWAGGWPAAAALGAVPLTQGETGVSALYWTVTGGALLYARLAVARGRHRRGN